MSGGGVTAGTNLEFFLEDIDDAPAFTIGAGDDVSGRTETTASTVVNGGWTTADRIVDIQSAVEEVIGRGGWASNNDIAVLAEDNASANGNSVAFTSYEGGSTTNFNAYYVAGGGGSALPIILQQSALGAGGALVGDTLAKTLAMQEMAKRIRNRRDFIRAMGSSVLFRKRWF